MTRTGTEGAQPTLWTPKEQAAIDEGTMRLTHFIKKDLSRLFKLWNRDMPSLKSCVSMSMGRVRQSMRRWINERSQEVRVPPEIKTTLAPTQEWVLTLIAATEPKPAGIRTAASGGENPIDWIIGRLESRSKACLRSAVNKKLWNTRDGEMAMTILENALNAAKNAFGIEEAIVPMPTGQDSFSIM